MSYVLKRDRALQPRRADINPEAVAFVVRFRAGKVLKQVGPFTYQDAIIKRGALRDAGIELDHQPERGILHGIGAVDGYERASFSSPDTTKFGYQNPDWYVRDTVIRAATDAAHSIRSGQPVPVEIRMRAVNAFGAVPAGPRRVRLQAVWNEITGESVGLPQREGAGREREEVSA